MDDCLHLITEAKQFKKKDHKNKIISYVQRVDYLQSLFEIENINQSRKQKLYNACNKLLVSKQTLLCQTIFETQKKLLDKCETVEDLSQMYQIVMNLETSGSKRTRDESQSTYDTQHEHQIKRLKLN